MPFLDVEEEPEPFDEEEELFEEEPEDRELPEELLPAEAVFSAFSSTS